MNEITILPEQLTAMTEVELAALPVEQLFEVHGNLTQLVAWVKDAQAKTHAALQRRYGEQERAARVQAGKDFGVVHIQDRTIRVTVDTPKRVQWDQKKLTELAQRILANGGRVEEYLDVELSIPEARFNHWPSELREQFAPARTVKPGKRVYELARTSDGEVLP